MSAKSAKAHTWLNRLPNLGIVTDAASIVAPFVSPERLPYPYRMTLVTTRQCNSRCQMCNIWQQKDLPQLSLEELQSIFDRNDFSFLRSITITGGEATMRADLPDLFEIVARGCKNLENVVLATSALNTRRTVRYVEQMLQTGTALLPRLRSFQIQVSIDGIGELHDEIRGIRGFFQIVTQTIDGLNQLTARYPMLEVRTATVVLAENIAHLDEIIQYTDEHDLPTCFSPVVISEGYYENSGQPIDLQATAAPNSSPVELFERLATTDATPMRFHYKNVARMFRGEQRSRACMMGYYDFVLEYNGDIFACVNCETYRFGNLFEQTFEEIWFGENGLKARQDVRANCCPTCPSPCHFPVVNAKELIELKAIEVEHRVSKALSKLTQPRNR